MEAERVASQISAWRASSTRFFATSSFQTASAVLLHLLHRFAPGTTVVFLNTGYHFVETLEHRRKLGGMLDLKIVDVFSPVSRVEQQRHGRPLFAVDPDRCCYLNKVLPLEPHLVAHDVWISGLRRQTDHRRGLTEFAEGPRGVRCWYPLIDWSDDLMELYLDRYELPRHPLDSDGRGSVGCEPCTRLRPGAARAGRWAGLHKTECGLHLCSEGSCKS